MSTSQKIKAANTARAWVQDLYLAEDPSEKEALLVELDQEIAKQCIADLIATFPASQNAASRSVAEKAPAASVNQGQALGVIKEANTILDQMKRMKPPNEKSQALIDELKSEIQRCVRHSTLDHSASSRAKALGALPPSLPGSPNGSHGPRAGGSGR